MKQTQLIAIALIIILARAYPVSAEPFIDLHAGYTFGYSNVFEFREAGDLLTVKDVDFNSSVSFGARFGWWTNFFPQVGVAVDAYHYRPDVDRQVRFATLRDSSGVSSGFGILAPIDISVTGVALNLLGRGQLMKSKEFPNGQLQPYIGAGPGIFITKVELTDRDDTSVAVGLDAKAGIKYFFTRNFAAFGEYAFTRHDLDHEFRDGGSTMKTNATLNNHHLWFGGSWHFDALK